MAYEEIEKQARDLERKLLRDQIDEDMRKLAELDERDPEVIEAKFDKYLDNIFGVTADGEPVAGESDEDMLDRAFGAGTRPAELSEDEELDRAFGLGLSGTESAAMDNAWHSAQSRGV